MVFKIPVSASFRGCSEKQKKNTSPNSSTRLWCIVCEIWFGRARVRIAFMFSTQTTNDFISFTNPSSGEMSLFRCRCATRNVFFSRTRKIFRVSRYLYTHNRLTKLHGRVYVPIISFRFEIYNGGTPRRICYRYYLHASTYSVRDILRNSIGNSVAFVWQIYFFRFSRRVVHEYGGRPWKTLKLNRTSPVNPTREPESVQLTSRFRSLVYANVISPTLRTNLFVLLL